MPTAELTKGIETLTLGYAPSTGELLNMPYYTLIFLTVPLLNICSATREILVEFSTFIHHNVAHVNYPR